MVERALRATVRNYWTVFFVVASVTVPLQIAYASIWHEVIAVRELHSDIERFPPLRQVHGVGHEQLNAARWTFWLIVLIEIALIPLLLRATQWVLEADADGRVAGALGAWAGALARLRDGTTLKALRRPGPVLVGATLALAVGGLAEAAGRLLIEPLGDERAFAGLGLVDGLARAAGAPFLLVIAAVAAASSTGARARE